MSALVKYWRVVLAIILVMAAIPVFFIGYLSGQENFNSESNSLNMEIRTLQTTIAENTRYTDVQDEIEDATADIETSRRELYQHFPVTLLEEDQIMYVLYLESLFGTEINFSFGSTAPIGMLSDGATSGGLTLTVNYETTYQGFKDMIEYLSTDSRITSIQYCTLNYDDASDTATGTLTLLLYVMNSDLLDGYQPPVITEPDTGKPNLFD